MGQQVRSHPYEHDEPTGACRLCGYQRTADVHRGVSQPPAVAERDDRVVWLLGAGVVILAVVGFWVIAEPHQQCYISDGYSTEYPIERTGPDTYRGVPSRFHDGDYISSDAVIDCRWEFGK